MMNARFMELELGLAPPNQPPMKKNIHRINPKSLDDDEGEEVQSNGLSLLLWSGQPNGQDDRNWRKFHVGDDEETSDNGEERVGWPPINSLRREWLQRHHGGWMAAADDGVAVPARNSVFVKVKMEGVPIGRKIDLSRCNSYQALTDALINLFDKYIKNEDGHYYTILYQDKDGDWLLAGDVPWEIFVESVQRVKILRNIGN